MDYNIVINGSVDDENEEEVVLTDACEMVADLEGVTSATFTSPNYSGVNMLEEQEAPAPAEEEEQPSEAPAEETPAEEPAEEAEEGGE